MTTNNATVELNENLLAKIKNEIEKKSIRDYKINISPGSTKGDNFLGVIAKVHVQGFNKCGENVNLDWIAKAAPKSEVFRNILNIELVYTREIDVYEKVFPIFQKFQDERAVLHPFKSYPHYILSHMEPYGESLVMENMKSLGYVMKNKKQPLDYNHVKLVMEAYGKMHAISFALRDQKPEEFQKLAEETREQLFSSVSGRFDKEELDKRQEKVKSRVLEGMHPEKDAKAIEVYSAFADNSLGIICDAVENVNEYSVIGHGDSWVNNMLFKYDNEHFTNRPTKVCLLDFQLARYGSPAFDLSYFIFTCTDKALRDKHYDDMIKFYYYSLCKHLSDLGSNPQKLFPFAALQAELKRASVLGFHLTIMVTHLMMSETDEIPDIHNTKSEDELMNGFEYQSVNEKVYQERIRGVVLDFVEKGYFDMAKV